MSSRTYASCPGANLTEELLPTETDSNIAYSNVTYSNITDSPSLTNTSEKPSAMPVTAPTMAPDPCSSMSVGSFPFFLVNTVDPDEVVILALEKIPGGMELYLTDQAWDGIELVRGFDKHDGAVVVSLSLGNCIMDA